MISNSNEDNNVNSIIDNTIFFGNDANSSFGGSDPDAFNLGSIFDRSTSFDVEVDNNSKLVLPPTLNPISLVHLERTLSHTTSLVESNEEKENDFGSGGDTIRDDILYVRHKASILQRASHILLQGQRDYHKVASYNACIEEETRMIPMNSHKISIWDEAKYFLQSENDAPDDMGIVITTTNQENNTIGLSAGTSDFHNVTSSMKSLSAVQQYCVANRNDAPPKLAVAVVASRAARPFIGPVGDTIHHIRSMAPRYGIDTSTVQCVTSNQYDTAAAAADVIETRALHEPIHRITPSSVHTNGDSTAVDHWYNQTCEDFSVPRTNEKKRKRRSMEFCPTTSSPSKTVRIVGRRHHERDIGSQNESILSRAGRKDREKAPLLPYYRLLSSFNQQRKEHKDRKLLHQVNSIWNSCES